MSDPESEAVRLLERIAARDETAMADFYRTFARQLYAFAVRLGGDPGQAEDVVVETMHEVWGSAGRFAGGSRVRTWLFSIARHRLVDALRREHRGRTVALDDAAELAEADDADALSRLAARQRATHLAACLERLSADHRECVHLVFYAELPLAEVAAIQGCPENTVKTRLFHAKRHLRRCLEQRLGEATHGD